ncbi:cytochrome P450 [Linderina pennispora]|uniref:Cytochrome P450 n=1 Tax=Linderina pennispora TaxID=61395 RepID=A0A1Y1W7T3_9FUNG|nr:cytochrome P450 [Linderina pennispora]ORX69296.1 cytochrome P450 [Linderina pennispora]
MIASVVVDTGPLHPGHHSLQIYCPYPLVADIPWILRRQKASTLRCMQLVRDTIETRKRHIQETGRPPRDDILQRFIDARDPETGQKLTPAQLEAEIKLMLLSGSDTTGNMLSFAIMNLMHCPECYKRVTEEVRSTFPDSSQLISFADANSKLPYLSAVIHESMRLNPSFASVLQRCVPAEVSPSRTASFQAVQMSLWANPGMFDPERFLGPDSANRLRDILTFSSGARLCPGRHLAMLEIYTVLANIVRKYDFSLPNDAPYGPHRVNMDGIPVEVPAETFGVTGPKNPSDNCWVNISLAETA